MNATARPANPDPLTPPSGSSDGPRPAPRSLRMSLKRGLARQAMDQARAADADLGRIFEVLAGAAPNRMAEDRVLRRLKRTRGVVRAARSAATGAIRITARSVRGVEARRDGLALFAETGLLYTRIEVARTRTGPAFRIVRLSFSTHALERLVERTDEDLRPILPTIDAEAVSGLAQVAGNLTLSDRDDDYLTSRHGLWAGSLDLTSPEEDWSVVPVDPEAGLPIFSVRTFLSEDEMRATAWLKWSDARRPPG